MFDKRRINSLLADMAGNLRSFFSRISKFPSYEVAVDIVISDKMFRRQISGINQQDSQKYPGLVGGVSISLARMCAWSERSMSSRG